MTAVTKKCRILNVVYNASNNELVRTNTLVKGSIVEVDSAPFRQWYEQHYGIKLGKKKVLVLLAHSFIQTCNFYCCHCCSDSAAASPATAFSFCIFLPLHL